MRKMKTKHGAETATLAMVGPQGEPLLKRYSEDQPREDNGRFGSGSGSTSKEYTPPVSKADRPDFSGNMKLGDGKVLALSGDRSEKVAQVKEFAKEEMSKLSPDTQRGLNAGEKTSDIYAVKDANGNPMKDANGVTVYTPERLTEFHNPTVEKALEGHVAQENPKITFVAGGPAAGKTTATDEAAANMGDHVAVNVDTIRTEAPEFTALLPDRLMPVNEETGDIRDRILNEAGAARYNLIVDGVGSKSASENVAKLVGSGYTASYVYVHREAEDARERANDRPFLTKNVADLRILPQGMVEKFHDKARDAFGDMAKVSSEVKVIDKSDPNGPHEGTVVFWKDAGGIRVYNPEGVRRVENGGKVKIRIYP